MGRKRDLGRCAIAGTLVNVIDGYKNIEDIEAGDTVLSFNVEEAKLFEQKIIDTGSFISDCVEVDSSLASPISCSVNHPFWTQRGWVDAEDLTIGGFQFNVTVIVLIQSLQGGGGVDLCYIGNVGQLHIIYKGKRHKRNGSQHSADDDEGGALAHSTVALVR